MQDAKRIAKRREYKRQCDAFCDIHFENYEGKKRFQVTHARHAATVVAAPDETAAIVAAAAFNGAAWQEYSYYAYCHVEDVTNSAKEEGKLK